jgi:two-component system sensor histidine kinase KdpD
MPTIRPWLQWTCAVAAAAAATGLCLLLDRWMSVAGLAMVYLLATAAAAVALRRGPAALTSVLCVSALNYFFVPPRHSFEVENAEYWWTLAVLLGLSLALGSLVARLRERRQAAERGQAEAAELHALAEALADCGDVAAMGDCAARLLHRATGRPCTILLRAPDAGSPATWRSPATAAFDAQAAAWAIDHGRPLGRGCVDWPDLRLWCAPFARHHGLGAVQLALADASTPDADTARHWLALARQVGLCMEREQAAAAARLAREEAQSESARNLLLASLSHDLRTPLAAIVGAASTLRTQADALPERQRLALLADLENEASDLAQMADNVLQLARLSQPQAQLRLQVESLDDVVGAAMARVRRRWPQARVQSRPASGVPLVRVEASLLAQVLVNLLDNAVRHGGDAGPVVVATGRSRQGAFVAVRDHGPGQPPGELARLFESYRGGSDGRPGAAGLGLAICRLVVLAHGGSVEARRCEPGLEVRIDLPAAALEGEPDD